ncbi:MAG TPA: TfoX/Sxy family protein [Ignavibacteria bacterium]|mgnify:CR=1 FL=1|nr:TfoX/Sxy family protein [Ignavibacteria bacterium]HMR39317.1 TfoX/Sxy family protein [Ignavibacteria bacterium]
MSYNQEIADSVREIFSLTREDLNVEEKNMFGGLCFMVNGKMCVGVEKEKLMVRLDPDKYIEALGKEGCSPMDFTGRPMKGFVYVEPVGMRTKKQLQYWLDLALEYNKIAKPSKKKKSNK